MLVKAFHFAEVVPRLALRVKNQQIVYQRGVMTSADRAKCCGFLQSKLVLL